MSLSFLNNRLLQRSAKNRLKKTVACIFRFYIVPKIYKAKRKKLFLKKINIVNTSVYTQSGSKDIVYRTVIAQIQMKTSFRPICLWIKFSHNENFFIDKTKISNNLKERCPEIRSGKKKKKRRNAKLSQYSASSLIIRVNLIFSFCIKRSLRRFLFFVPR